MVNSYSLFSDYASLMIKGTQSLSGNYSYPDSFRTWRQSSATRISDLLILPYQRLDWKYFSASQPQSDLPSRVQIWHTGINFGCELRRHVGGGNWPLFVHFNYKLRVVIKSKSKAVEVYVCRFWFIHFTNLFLEDKYLVQRKQVSYLRSWVLLQNRVLYTVEHSTLFSVDIPLLWVLMEPTLIPSLTCWIWTFRLARILPSQSWKDAGGLSANDQNQFTENRFTALTEFLKLFNCRPRQYPR